MSFNRIVTANLITFTTEEILNGKFYFFLQCKMLISIFTLLFVIISNISCKRSFSCFAQIIISWVVSWVKEHKITEKDKKLYLWHSIFQKQYMILSSFVILDFLKFLERSKGKKWLKMTKNFVCRALHQYINTSYGCDFWYISVR